jgi:hypothetical protein
MKLQERNLVMALRYNIITFMQYLELVKKCDI